MVYILSPKYKFGTGHFYFDTPSTVWVSLPIVGSLLAFFLKILRKKLTDRSFADQLGK